MRSILKMTSGAKSDEFELKRIVRREFALLNVQGIRFIKP